MKQNPVKNSECESCLRKLLINEGFKLSLQRASGETGVDILASKNNEDLHIEVIGYKKTGPARAKDFYEIFFRAVSRLNNGAQNCVIALPKQFGVGLPARAGQHRVAWERIGKAFPELEIWLVDVDKGSYKKTSWVYWLGK